MKKLSILILLIVVANLSFAQTHASITVEDSVYEIIDNAQLRGLCNPLPSVKPYSELSIKKAIEEILVNAGRKEKRVLTKIEEQILYDCLSKFERKQGFDAMRGSFYAESKGKVRATVDASFKADTFVSGGIYNNKSDNQWGLSITPIISAKGDLGTHLSYDFNVFGNGARAVLKSLGEYEIGKYWYTKPGTGYGQSNTTNWNTSRYIKSFSNKAYLPFSYSKTWDGSVYKPSNLTASGLEGWCDNFALGFGINSEIDVSFLDNKIAFRLGRMKREWAGMDKGSSLVINSRAHPFLAIETTITPIRWFSLSMITGVLEFPNSSFIVGDIYNTSFTDYDNATFFQNAYSAAMLELNFKYVHFDFGTSSVWPKRFELGYFFPLMDKVFYQNNIGDFDNIALFGNLKLTYPGMGYVWTSLFIDEFNGLSKVSGLLGDFLHSTRNMYATQVGAKFVIPRTPFATISCRYTKVEPYCYTHQALNYTPWYPHYISEAHMNAGEPIGYYLPPNSDEVLVRFDVSPLPSLKAHGSYQFIRHGAEFGSQQVQGSSLYSELSPYSRDNIKKYFLHDGAYQWFHIINMGAEWSLKKFKAPVTVYADIGFVYSYFTVITEGSANDNAWHPHTIANTSEYPTEFGAILSTGVKVYF
ncbi:MAG: hypothetical protein IJR49_03440 [Treponema sp.]|nr:hypothetical protein [Treponema sp.]